MNKVEQAIADITAKATKALAEEGYYKINTCDDPNWPVHEHYAMIKLLDNPPAGMNIKLNVRFNTSEWTIIEDRGGKSNG